MKLTWPAPERNKLPILDVLRRVLPERGTVLELASGTGQHAVYFAEHLPHSSWQPSDLDPANLASIRAWREEHPLANLRAPLRVDVCTSDWGVGQVEAMFNANMIHIAPWECCVGLFHGAQRHLASAGVLVMYGPFRIGGAHTAESNARFDADLRARDARWGVRDLEAVLELAIEAGLVLEERVEMPANNQMLMLRKHVRSRLVSA